MSSIRSILEEAVNRVEWCVNPEQLAAVTINREKETVIIDQALKEISELIDGVIGEDEIDFERDALGCPVGEGAYHKIWNNELKDEIRQSLKELLK